MTPFMPQSDAGEFILVDPAPDTLVLPSHRLRPGIDPDRLPRLRDEVWLLSYMMRKETVRPQIVNWGKCSEAFRASLMRVGWAVLNIPTPAVLLQEKASRAVMSPRALRMTFSFWMDFARWLVERGVTALDSVTQDDLGEYAEDIRAYGRSWRHDRRALKALTRIWGYAPFLLPQDRLVMPPWEDPHAVMTDFLGSNDDSDGGEANIPIVHPAVMSPLLVWALRMVMDLGPDILAAWHERQRLLDRIPEKSPRGSLWVVVHYLRDLIGKGEPLPAFSGFQTRGATAAARARSGREPLPSLNQQFITGTLGVSVHAFTAARRSVRDELEARHFGLDAPLAVPIAGRIGDRPWTESIDFDEVKDLVLHLSTAALILTSYLSGMRPEEVLHLVRGCCTREERKDGTVRYNVRGLHFKSAIDKDGNTIPEGVMRPDPWVVLEFVASAVAVVEELETGDLIFSRGFSWGARASADGGDAVTPDMAVKRIRTFTVWANEMAVRHERPHELIPQDPDGPVALRRFRRTIAWFIYRQPGGRIAAAVQFGHAATLMAESYAGRSKMDMLDVLDFEKGLALADALSAAGGRIAAGEGVSGPAAGRYITAATEFENRYAGSYMGKRELRQLVSNPKLQVYESPRAFLTCNFDAFKALCDPELARGRANVRQTPDHSRCNLACGNISRTDSQIAEARGEIGRIDADAEAGLDPYPIAEREQQRRALLVDIVERHEAEKTIPAPADGKGTRDQH